MEKRCKLPQWKMKRVISGVVTFCAVWDNKLGFAGRVFLENYICLVLSQKIVYFIAEKPTGAEGHHCAQHKTCPWPLSPLCTHVISSLVLHDCTLSPITYCQLFWCILINCMKQKPAELKSSVFFFSKNTTNTAHKLAYIYITLN